MVDTKYKKRNLNRKGKTFTKHFLTNVTEELKVICMTEIL